MNICNNNYRVHKTKNDRHISKVDKRNNNRRQNPSFQTKAPGKTPLKARETGASN